MARIERIGVVGCGTMGSGICEVAARAGYEVVFREVDEATVAAGMQRIRASVDRAVKRGKLDEAGARALIGRISGTVELSGLADCDLIFEAVPEVLEAKRATFAELDKVARPEAVFATNTSSLPVIDMAVATGRPARVIGFHFFNPAQVMKLVEVVHTVRTDPTVVDSAVEFARGLGKVPVVCRDRAGFVANRLLFAYLVRAVRLLESGHCDRDGVDAAMRLACGHPMGPFELLDLIGLDTAAQICEALWRQWRDPSDAPPPLLTHLVAAGLFGRKSGRGFYEHPSSPGPQEGLAPHGVSSVWVEGSGAEAALAAATAVAAGCEVLVDPGDEPGLRAGLSKLSAGPERVRVAPPREVRACELLVHASTPDPGRLGALEAQADPQAVVATTGTGSLARLAAGASRPQRVVGLSFPRGPHRGAVVEVTTGPATDDAAASRVAAWARAGGRHALVCPDRPGGVVEHLLFCLLNEAVRMSEEGYASPGDIDTAMTLGCGHPEGPFAVLEQIGPGIVAGVLRSMHAALGDSRLAPTPRLCNLALTRSDAGASSA